jgi:hypothetical protein
LIGRSCDSHRLKLNKSPSNHPFVRQDWCVGAARGADAGAVYVMRHSLYCVSGPA